MRFTAARRRTEPALVRSARQTSPIPPLPMRSISTKPPSERGSSGDIDTVSLHPIPRRGKRAREVGYLLIQSGHGIAAERAAAWNDADRRGSAGAPRDA